MKKVDAKAAAMKIWQALSPDERMTKRPVAIPVGNPFDPHVNDYRPALEWDGGSEVCSSHEADF